MTVYANWSILSKYPDDENDYRIISSSKEQIEGKKVFPLIRQWMVGELPYQAADPLSGAPRYICGIEKTLSLLIITEQNWTAYSDSSGRPVQQYTSLFIPFQNAAEHALSFHQMTKLFNEPTSKSFLDEKYAGIMHGRETPLDRSPMPISLPSREEALNYYVKSLSQFELGDVINLTAVLLDKPLGLTWFKENKIALHLGIRWLDAILALLPYGLRFDCPASSWASATVKHHMRLYWCKGVLSDHHHARFSDAGLRCNFSGGDGYSSAFNQKLEKIGLTRLVDHLSRIVEPMQFSENLSEELTGRISKISSFSVPSRQRGNVIKLATSQNQRRTTSQQPSETPDRANSQKLFQEIQDDFFEEMPEKDGSRLRDNVLNLPHEQVFDFLSQLHRKIEQAPKEKNHYRNKFLKLIINLINRDPNGQYLQGLADVFKELPSHYWMFWIHGIVNHDWVLESIQRALKAYPDERSPLIQFIRYILGMSSSAQIKESDLDATFQNESMSMPILMVQLDAQMREHDDDVSLAILNWIKTQEQKGREIPEKGFSKMKADANLSDKVKNFILNQF
jgi:hypothetical protein